MSAVTFINDAADKSLRSERAAIDLFLDHPNEDSFAALFKLFAPQIRGFFRARNCESGLAEDLTQDVMLTVYRKAQQLKDRSLFRAWLFKIARHRLYRHCDQQSREVTTVEMDNVNDGQTASRPGHTLFEFQQWMSLLDSQEQDVMTLRFVEEWEYHEIATARAIPIGTVQWRVHNSKKKLAAHLAARPEEWRKAA